MKTLGWIALIVGLLGCIWAGVIGTVDGESHGIAAIGVAIAAFAAVLAGVKLIELG
jgi:hypothetical protein